MTFVLYLPFKYFKLLIQNTFKNKIKFSKIFVFWSPQNYFFERITLQKNSRCNYQDIFNETKPLLIMKILNLKFILKGGYYMSSLQMLILFAIHKGKSRFKSLPVSVRAPKFLSDQIHKWMQQKFHESRYKKSANIFQDFPSQKLPEYNQ